MHPRNVAIVGGSLAGCSAAILLGRAGHRVSVFERSPRDLVGRIGGFRIPGTLFAELVASGIIDADFPHTTCTSMRFGVRTPDEEQFGRVPWSLPIDLKAFHWNALWRALRSRVPDVHYRRGVEVVGVTTTSDRATLTMAGGTTADFDLVLFADGARSTGRRLLFPDVDVMYRGYMLWRGMRPEAELAGADQLDGHLSRFACAGLPGHFVAYLVPSDAGSTMPGDRVVNWAAYLPLADAERNAFMIDRTGAARGDFIGPGHLRPEVEQRLKGAIDDCLPTFYANLVAGTRHTSVQLIHTVAMRHYRSGRCGFIGDAGHVAQPFTGSGVFKGYQNVVDLLHALEAHASLDDALATWARDQAQFGNRLLALGEQMEQALIWNPIDLATSNATETEAWWKAAVAFPRDFTYEAGAG